MKKIYIIHGWTYDLEKWQALLPLLTTKQIDPVLLRVPGLTAASDEVWDIEGYIAWLQEQLGDDKEPIVIGHSNGGRIALAYAQKYPNSFKQLILIDSAGLTNRTLLRKLKLKILYILAKLSKPFAAIPLVRKVGYKIIGARDYREAPPNMRQTMANMLAADKTINLTAINVPITLIWGSQDTTTPLTDGQAMQRLLPNATLHIIDGARHAPQDTHAEQVADLIAKALEP